MGEILYNGPFNPVFHEPQQPYQNFTVAVPYTTKGTAVLEVLHLGLLGVRGALSEYLYSAYDFLQADNFLFVETPNVTLHIV
jgi:hypothetical protein